MNISYQFKQIGVFLAYNGFVSVLKKLTMTFMPSIIRNCVSGKKSLHQVGNTGWATPDEKMGVICHESPCVALALCFWKENRETFNEIFSVFVVIEYSSPLDSSDHDVM